MNGNGPGKLAYCSNLLVEAVTPSYTILEPTKRVAVTVASVFALFFSRLVLALLERNSPLKINGSWRKLSESVNPKARRERLKVSFRDRRSKFMPYPKTLCHSVFVSLYVKRSSWCKCMYCLRAWPRGARVLLFELRKLRHMICNKLTHTFIVTISLLYPGERSTGVTTNECARQRVP